MRISFVFLLSLFFFFLSSTSLSFAVERDGTFDKIDFTSPLSQIDFFLRISGQHRGFFSKNARYSTNPFERLSHVPQILKQLKNLGSLHPELFDNENAPIYYSAPVDPNELDPKRLQGSKRIEGLKSDSVYSLEFVPPLVALFRGFIGMDCSLVAVAYYALLKGVSIYWVRKGPSAGSKIMGYALVVESQIGHQKVPYLLTLNGATLRKRDVLPLAKLIAGIYHSPFFLYPDFEVVKDVMNFQDLVDGFEELPTSTKIKVKLPMGWSAIDQFPYLKVNAQDQDYYLEPEISSASLVGFRSEDIKVYKSLRTNLYPQQKAAELPLIDRSLLGAYALEWFQIRDYSHLATTLHLTVEQLALGYKIISVNRNMDSLLAGEQINEFDFNKITFGLLKMGSHPQDHIISLRDLLNIQKQFTLNKLQVLRLFHTNTARIFAEALIQSDSWADKFIEHFRTHSKAYPRQDTIGLSYLKSLELLTQWPSTILNFLPELFKETPHLLSFLSSPRRLALLRQQRWPQELWTFVSSRLSDVSDMYAIRALLVASLPITEGYPIQIHEVLRKVMKDSSYEVRRAFAYNLQYQRQWPLFVWNDFHYLMINDPSNITSEALRKQEIWDPEFVSRIPNWLKKSDSFGVDPLIKSLPKLEVWPDQTEDILLDLVKAEYASQKKLNNFWHSNRINLIGEALDSRRRLSNATWHFLTNLRDNFLSGDRDFRRHLDLGWVLRNHIIRLTQTPHLKLFLADNDFQYLSSIYPFLTKLQKNTTTQNHPHAYLQAENKKVVINGTQILIDFINSNRTSPFAVPHSDSLYIRCLKALSR